MSRVELLHQHFSAAAIRMAELPLYNPELAVSTRGFQPYADGEIGILITPWCMNLVFFSALDAQQKETQAESLVGSKKLIALPSGQYEFIAGWSEALGLYYSCSLFSPMFEFADQAGAEATADEVLNALFVAEHYAPTDRQIAIRAEKEAQQEQERRAQANAAAQQSKKAARGRADGQPEISRRGFLTGGFRRDQDRAEL